MIGPRGLLFLGSSHLVAVPFSPVWVLLPVFDWPFIMIGPGGLLIRTSSHLRAIPFPGLWVGLQRSKELNLDVINIFSGSHTEHRWGFSQ
jgi:hypothetical protein